MYIFIVIHRKRVERFSYQEEQSYSRGFDPIRQTERRGVPYLLTLHLRCVCHFSRFDVARQSLAAIYDLYQDRFIQ